MQNDHAPVRTTDLVRRLRSQTTQMHVSGDKWTTVPDHLCHEAAAVIERLTERVAELEQLKEHIDV